MPGGVNSPVRAFKNVGGKPVFFKSAKGPILTDEDENQYIDFIGSWGPMILGHSNPIILEAIKAQLELGTSYGAPTSIENSLASIIKSQVPSMEKLRMVNSGTEATMSCIRLARGCTGKNKIIKFREDEIDHKDIAYEQGATKEGPYSILDKIIKTGSKIAINISEKI